MAVAEPCSRPRKQLDAGVFQPEISSFRLHLAAEGKAAKTIRLPAWSQLQRAGPPPR
jgi:hypothetical protein